MPRFLIDEKETKKNLDEKEGNYDIETNETAMFVPNLITIDQIVKKLSPTYVSKEKYLQVDNPDLAAQKTESTKKFPKFFRSVFKGLDYEYFRLGIGCYNKKVNYTFLGAILACLSSDDSLDLYSLVPLLKSKLGKDSLKNQIYTNNKYFKLYGWRKKDLADSIVNKTVSNILIKYVADYFYLNIWIFDKTNEELYVHYCKESKKMNPYYPHIILYKSENDRYTPIINTTDRVFSYDSEIAQALINKEISATPIIKYNIEKISEESDTIDFNNHIQIKSIASIVKKINAAKEKPLETAEEKSDSSSE